MDDTGDDTPSFHVRKMDTGDMPQALRVFADHGLHEGLNSLATFQAIDGDAFYVAVDDCDDETVLGVCGGPFTNPNFGFIGLYGVKKGLLGKGIGTQVFAKVMEYAGGRNVGLAAVPTKVELYRDKLGFKVPDGHSMTIYSGKIANFKPATVEGVEIKPMEDEFWPQVLDYDCSVHGYRRNKLLKLSFSEATCITMVALKNEQIVGLGCCREDTGGKAMLAPIYADDSGIADQLIGELLIKYLTINKTDKAVLYSLDTNPNAKQVADKYGLKEHEKCPRFFTKKAAKVDNQRIFGLLSPNFSL